ncbi:MAG: TetR/AcrR family transcriptional regulator [Sulfitobacter sp.]
MRSEKRQARMEEIEAEAYRLFSSHGFDSTSMLAVAKAAKASNETMYRWYGDKAGLFASMVKANAAEVREVLKAALAGRTAPEKALHGFAPVLLGMLLGERAILLNRAAASDPTGSLGALLAQGGREDVLPLIRDVLTELEAAQVIAVPEGWDAGALLVKLLVGDSQVRRIIGTMAAPTDAEVAAQAAQGVAQFLALCASK